MPKSSTRKPLTKNSPKRKSQKKEYPPVRIKRRIGSDGSLYYSLMSSRLPGFLMGLEMAYRDGKKYLKATWMTPEKEVLVKHYRL